MSPFHGFGMWDGFWKREQAREISAPSFRGKKFPPRPILLLSAASGEFKTARGFTSRLLHSLGLDPKDHELAAGEHRSLRAMLRKGIDRSAGIIRPIGPRNGREPVHPGGTPNPGRDFARRTHRQFEPRCALQTGKPLCYLFTGGGCPSAMERAGCLIVGFRKMGASLPSSIVSVSCKVSPFLRHVGSFSCIIGSFRMNVDSF